jgi:hypothetical protein
LCGQAIVDVAVGAESVSGVAEDPLRLRRMGSDCGEDRCPDLKYAVHEGNGSVVRRVVWVGFIGFVYEFYGANAPFPMCVALFGHSLEECIYEVVGCVK